MHFLTPQHTHITVDSPLTRPAQPPASLRSVTCSNNAFYRYHISLDNHNTSTPTPYTTTPLTTPVFTNQSSQQLIVTVGCTPTTQQLKFSFEFTTFTMYIFKKQNSFIENNDNTERKLSIYISLYFKICSKMLFVPHEVLLIYVHNETID